jgi:hypothetical protein
MPPGRVAQIGAASSFPTNIFYEFGCGPHLMRVFFFGIVPVVS